MINSIAVIGGAAILNRVAGSDLYGLNPPGKALLYIAPLVAVLSILCAP